LFRLSQSGKTGHQRDDYPKMVISGHGGEATFQA
jgi:hypothetical protein